MISTGKIFSSVLIQLFFTSSFTTIVFLLSRLYRLHSANHGETKPAFMYWAILKIASTKET